LTRIERTHQVAPPAHVQVERDGEVASAAHAAELVPDLDGVESARHDRLVGYVNRTHGGPVHKGFRAAERGREVAFHVRVARLGVLDATNEVLSNL